MACDILVLSPHPDDAEIHCGGTIASMVRQGARVVVADATAGELSSRGTLAQRQQETAQASAILGLHERCNLALPDGYLSPDESVQRDAVVACIRRWRPAIILTISERTAHPDHRALAALSLAALKAAELHRLPGQGDPAHRDALLFAYEAEVPLTGAPAFLVPVTEEDWQRKQQALACYGSQFSAPSAGEHATSIAGKPYADWIQARGTMWGFHARAPYAEAFTAPLGPPVLSDLRWLARPRP
jgi:bacillithiol biosynthesis deacetylase BshB1